MMSVPLHTGVKVALWLASGLGALVLMEFWADFLHGRVWHGALWFIHKSHHEPRPGRWEANDALSSLHAPIAIALILYGCLGAPSAWRELAYGWGFGMSAFGLLYLLFHDGLMHGRLPVGFLSKVPYFRLVCDAHAIHHEKNGGPYGFFRVAPGLRRLLARRAAERAARGEEAAAAGAGRPARSGVEPAE
jgi:beta-carotene 3-hydroxylase